MIPKFNKNGYLPKGIHKATLSEIKRRFGGGTERREELFKGLQSLVRVLRKNRKSIKRFLLNGSFVTDKREPEDYDCILVIRSDFSPRAMKQLTGAKNRFGAHLFPFGEEKNFSVKRMVDFFGHDRDAKPKGLVEAVL